MSYARGTAWSVIVLGLAAGCTEGRLAPPVTNTPRATAAMTLVLPPSLEPTATQTATPQPSPTPTPDCPSRAGRVEEGAYPGVVTGEALPFRIYLPPCFPQPERRYPVLFLLHGKPREAADWEAMGVVQVAQDGIEAGAWPPFLIVMPLVPEPLFSWTDGGPGSYEQELSEGLVAFIEHVWPTDARPEGRALAGISRGGVWALEVGFRRPDLFDTVIALSPALVVNSPRPAFDPMLLPVGASRLPASILLMAGDRDYTRPDTERLVMLLEQEGRMVRLEILPGGHIEATWTPALPLVLEFVSAAWSSGE